LSVLRGGKTSEGESLTKIIIIIIMTIIIKTIDASNVAQLIFNYFCLKMSKLYDHIKKKKIHKYKHPHHQDDDNHLHYNMDGNLRMFEDHLLDLEITFLLITINNQKKNKKEPLVSSSSSSLIFLLFITNPYIGEKISNK
jgi:rRNA maturation protein Rpf1